MENRGYEERGRWEGVVSPVGQYLMEEIGQLQWPCFVWNENELAVNLPRLSTYILSGTRGVEL